MEKQYTPEQLQAAEEQLDKALAYTKEAVATLGKLEADGTVPYDMDSEVCVSWCYLWNTRNIIVGLKNQMATTL